MKLLRVCSPLLFVGLLLGQQVSNPGGASISSPSTNGIVFWDGTKATSTATGGAGTLCLVSSSGGTPVFGACSGTASTVWSALTAPVATLSLAMGANPTTFTYNATTGAINGMKYTDTASNTGTGILGYFTTASGSAMTPWQADANGVGWKVGATGLLTMVGATSIVSPTISGHPVIEGVTSTGATGTGAFVFSASPTIVTPTIASFVNATHNHQAAAGGGTLAEAALSLSDVTTGNATTSAHGFVPKGDGNSAHFLNGNLGWTAGSGSGDMLAATYDPAAYASQVEVTVHKGAANGYAGLDSGSKVPAANTPAAGLNGVLKYTTGVPAAIGTSATNCVHEDGSSGSCSGASLPSTSDLLKGNGSGGAADTKVSITAPTTAWTIVPAADNQTTTIPAGTLLASGGALGTPSSGSAANLTSFPTLNQNTTGTAGGLSGTALGGDVTNSGNTVTVTKVNGGSVPASAGLLGSDSSNRPIAATAVNLSGVQYAAGGGSANAQTATYTPANGSLTDGLGLCWKPTAANSTTTPTFAPDGLTAHTIVKAGGALSNNDLLTTAIACARYDSTGTQWELQNPQTTAAGSVPSGTDGQVLGYPAGTATAISPVMIASNTFSLLAPSGKAVVAYLYGTSANHNDLYTCPTLTPQVRCFVAVITAYNQSATSCFVELNLGGTYFQASSTTGPASGNPALYNVGFVLEQGQKLAINCGGSGTSTNVQADILQFNNTLPFRTSYRTTFTGSTTTDSVYTAPVSTHPMVYGAPNGQGGQLRYVNTTGGSISSVDTYVVPAASVASCTNTTTCLTWIMSSPTVANNTQGAIGFAVALNPSDQIFINTGSSGAQIAWVTVWEGQ